MGWPLGERSIADISTILSTFLISRCWPELPNSQIFGSWCYLALARLATEGIHEIHFHKKRDF